MPKVTSLSSIACYAYTIAVVLLLGEIMLFLCSYCIKEGLVYVILASPLF